ncbi:hypothetical protein HDV57DRAFT_141898 [Trichoderma longibrachiatum]|uniref:Uncharacterized protein n=1 Tax=Trichoderma longibrachiatum ATCC 18648 TaxID=983965 RepID=A0A2T4C6S3_TRILO|nr:hypothetical protein M440DRAFT_1206817 [Trichoderma longibrachiatum ATCC 18648]
MSCALFISKVELGGKLSQQFPFGPGGRSSLTCTRYFWLLPETVSRREKYYRSLKIDTRRSLCCTVMVQLIHYTIFLLKGKKRGNEALQCYQYLLRSRGQFYPEMPLQIGGCTSTLSSRWKKKSYVPLNQEQELPTIDFELLPSFTQTRHCLAIIWFDVDGSFV